MTEPRQRRTKLSKNLLQMKFMKRSSMREEEEGLEAEQQKQIDDEHWVLDVPELAQKQSKYETERSYSRCQNLLYGRMSFKGFNPEIEKLMFQMNMEKEMALARAQVEEEERNNAEADLEMAMSYSALSGTIGKKFLTKRSRQQVEDESIQREEYDDDRNLSVDSRKKKKKKFLKPKD